jgi:flagellar M-ring protein FliF
MDFLNKAYGQISELFKGMTPGSRITAGMLLVMIAVSLVYLFVFQSHGTNKFLYDGREFSESELNEMEAAFAQADLGDYDIVGSRVRIPGRKQVQYLQALEKSNFTPLNSESAIQDALNNSRSLLESSEVTRLRFDIADQQRLGQTISKFPGIERATAKYREYRKGGFPAEIQRKGAIAACGKGNQPIKPSVIDAIRDLAAGWWGIDSEDIVVTDVNSQHSYLPETDGLGKESKLYAQMKRENEEQYKAKIYDCLSVYPGVVVGVNIEMDPDMSYESSKVVVDPQTIPLESETFRKTHDSGPVSGGRPGAVPNEVQGNVGRELASGSNQKSSTDESREEQRSTTGHEQTIRRKAPFVVTSATATISLPKSYIRDLWKSDPNHADPAGGPPKEPTLAEQDALEKQVIESIKTKVVHLLPPMDVGNSPFPQVEVSTYGDLPPLPLPEPSMAATTLAWFLDNWQTLGLFAVGLTSLLFLRSMIRASAPRATPTMETVAQPTALEEQEGGGKEQEEEEEAQVMLQRRVRPTGSSLREELIAMVREDPDAAANVLRTWIGEAA